MHSFSVLEEEQQGFWLLTMLFLLMSLSPLTLTSCAHSPLPESCYLAELYLVLLFQNAIHESVDIINFYGKIKI
jgi:hypothetical protein